jgi:Tfp pilus assembly protein PilF
LSKLFANELAGAMRSGVLGASAALLLAACGASTPRQAGVEPQKVVTPEPTAAEPRASEPTEAAKPPVAESKRRRDRRADHADVRAAAATPPPVAAPADNARRRDRHADRAEPEDAGATPVVEAVPEAASAAYDRALTAMRAEDWLSAEVELQQLTAEYPSYPGPFVNLAIVYMHDGHGDEARKALDAALAIDPGHAAANNQLGILLREQGKFKESEQAYRRALATDPNHALAHYNLGVLLDIYLRRPAEAVEQYEAYQSSLAAPDENVGRWIIDLRRRSGSGGDAARVAQGADQ